MQLAVNSKSSHVSAHFAGFFLRVSDITAESSETSSRTTFTGSFTPVEDSLLPARRQHAISFRIQIKNKMTIMKGFFCSQLQLFLNQKRNM